MAKCVPEEEGTQTEESEELKRKLSLYKNQNMEYIITFEEVKSVMSKFNNNKALGSDNFRIEIIKNFWRYSPSVLLNL